MFAHSSRTKTIYLASVILQNYSVCQWQKNPIHMQDNTLFIFLSHHIPPQAASVCCEYKCQNTQFAVKTLDFSEALVPCEIYCWQNWTFFTDFSSRKVVWGDGFNFIAHMCNLAWDASIEYHFAADGVLVCVNCSIQYCHWVNPFTQSYWKCWTGSGISCSIK